MNRYTVYVQYTIEDSIEVEAEDEYEAEKVALEERGLYAMSSQGGYSVSWDMEEVIDIILEEEDVDE